MRRIGLFVSSLLSVGLLLGAARALASPVPAGGRPVEKKLERPAPTKGRQLFTPAGATRNGLVDDRLIRPERRALDASAGLLG